MFPHARRQQGSADWLAVVGSPPQADGTGLDVNLMRVRFGGDSKAASEEDWLAKGEPLLS